MGRGCAFTAADAWPCGRRHQCAKLAHSAFDPRFFFFSRDMRDDSEKERPHDPPGYSAIIAKQFENIAFERGKLSGRRGGVEQRGNRLFGRPPVLRRNMCQHIAQMRMRAQRGHKDEGQFGMTGIVGGV